MKILIPTDFSRISVNAVRWAIKYADGIGGADLEILHCIDSRGRSQIFLDIDSILIEKAEEDMSQLLKAVQHESRKSTITTLITNLNPKEAILKRAKSVAADCIILGTQGLTNVKDLTIGSVTEYLVDRTSTPVIAIPEGSDFNAITNVVIGVDQERMQNPKAVFRIHEILQAFDPIIHLIQVSAEASTRIKVKSEIKNYLKNFQMKSATVASQESISSTLEEQCRIVGAELLCIIHHHSNWLSRLFRQSLLKEELFNISLPVLFIPDKK